MKIMVFDVPAESGGALSILKQYYNTAIGDRENQWIFVVSKPELEACDNVTVLRFPWIKKSWAHRLWFDTFFAKKLVKEHKPDKVISLQNTSVKAGSVFQELYVHQALIFCEKKFSVKESKALWMYQNVISRLIFRSIKKVDRVIVQTNWMKDAIVERLRVNSDKIAVVPPVVNIDHSISYKKPDSIRFFYPAAKSIYKNHSLIYKAVRLLKEKGYGDFKVILTIEKPAGVEDIAELIEFCGYMGKEDMAKSYSSSVLLFPSYLESFGLPLLEARTCGCPIIASDCAFSREILDDYENKRYFNPFSAEELAEVMEKAIDEFKKVG